MLKYRKDIDGLRAIAVLAVVLFHAFPKVIKGGFLGVDIFFVISGYLITSIIIKDFNNDNFSIYKFYSRRIKRIFPSLITVITICLIFGWYTLTNDELSHLTKHIKASSLFYINFVLAHESGYFDIATSLKPLMHLWSLAIEEQFYIFWPLLIYFARKNSFNLLSIFGIIFLVSLIISITTTSKNPVIAFYYPFARICELTAGGLIAFIKSKNFQIIGKLTQLLNNLCNLAIYGDKSTHTNTTLINTLSIIGFLINLLSIIFLKNTKYFPGMHILLPIIGTVMIIIAGENSYINKKILSRKVMIWIGLISYPLYLWHWPLFAFANILEGEDLTTNIIIVILIVSIFMAWLTYLLIEKPIRYSKNKKLVPVILILFMAILGASGFYIEKNIDNIPRLAHSKSFFPKRLIKLKEMTDSRVDCRYLKPVGKDIKYPYNFCYKNSDNPKVAIIGDSHVISYAYGFMLNEINTLSIALSGRIPFINYINFNKLEHSKEQVLASYMPTITYRYIAQKTQDAEYVILVSRAPVYFTGKDFVVDYLEGYVIEPKNYTKEFTHDDSKKYFVAGYVELIKFLIKNGKKVIFAIDIPELGFEPKTCITRTINLSKKQIHDCKLERKKLDKRQEEYRQLIAEIKRQVPSLFIYDPIDVLCDENYCYAKKGNKVFYADSNHLSSFGTKSLIKHFKKWFDKNIAPFESLKDTSKTNENLENL